MARRSTNTAASEDPEIRDPMDAAIIRPGEGSDSSESEEDGDAAAGDELSSSEDTPEPGDDANIMLSSVSFGALSRAQDSLGDSTRKRKRGEEANPEHREKLAAMRERLQELRQRSESHTKSEKRGKLQAGDAHANLERAHKQRGDFFTNGHGEDDEASNGSGSADEDDDDDDDESDASEHAGNQRQKRSSKHAPTAMSANRAVGRYREVVDIPKIKSRDPRFDVTSGHLDRNALQSRYSFLDSYQADELTSLKKALKDPKAKLSQDQREKLQRKVISLESKISASKARAREEKVRREHRATEREAVAQGKKPFYLKKGEVKKQALVDRFEGMKSRQKDKVIQRRRKKLAAKEKKSMPMERRM